MHTGTLRPCSSMAASPSTGCSRLHCLSWRGWNRANSDNFMSMGSAINTTDADITFSCEHEQYSRNDIIIGQHTLLRMISGEMRVVQPGQTVVFGAGDSFLLP